MGWKDAPVEGVPKPMDWRSAPVEEANAQQYAVPAPEGQGRSAFEYADDVVRMIANGVTFGLADEIAAGASSLTGIASQGDGTYEGNLAAERARDADFREDSPVAATGAEIVGAIPTALLPLGAGARATSLLGRMGQGAAVAGGQGAAYGFNTGEGGAANRLKNAAMTGAIAAPIGAAAPAVGAGARGLAGSLMGKRAARNAGMSPAAHQMLTRTIDADGSLSGPGAARLAAIGDDAVLADAGPNAMSVLDTAVRRSGPAATIARNAVDDRVSAASQRFTRALDDTLGAPQGVRATARNTAQSTAGVRGDAYRAAYSAPIDYAAPAGRKIESVLARISPDDMTAAVREANKDMLADGLRNQQIMASIADDGSVTFREMPNVQQLDYIKRALGAMGKETDNLGRPTQGAMRAQRLSRELRGAVTEAVPEYAEALRLGGDKIAMDDALRLGQNLFRSGTSREVVAEAVEGMTDAERAMVGTGLRAHIDDTLARVKRTLTDPNVEAREALKGIKEFSSRENRDKLSMVLGDDQAQKLFDEIDQITAAFEMRAGVAANSRTFARDEVNETVRTLTEDGVVNAFRSGEPVNAGQRLAQTLMGRTAADKTRIADETFVDLARALTGPRGPMATRLLQSLQQGAQVEPRAGQIGSYAEYLMRRAGTPVVGPVAN